jgi:hypothetical protein
LSRKNIYIYIFSFFSSREFSIVCSFLVAMDYMEEKNIIVSDETPIVTTKDHAPPGSQVATGGSDPTLEPNNPGGGVVGGSGGSGSEGVVESTVKRKRGRPRKYDVDANLVSSPPPPQGLSSSLSSYEKRGRGRPRGSGKLQLLASLGEYSKSAKAFISSS